MTLIELFPRQMRPAHRWEQEFQTYTARYTESQLRWLLRAYADETPYPNPRDYVTYLATAQDVPDDLLARAALQGGRAAAPLVQEIMELEAAWFPTEDTEFQLQELRARLKAALV